MIYFKMTHLVNIVLGEVLEDNSNIEIFLDRCPVQLHLALHGKLVSIKPDTVIQSDSLHVSKHLLINLRLRDEVYLVLHQHHGDVPTLILHLLPPPLHSYQGGTVSG